MSINVVCVKNGTLYNYDYVNKLYSMVKRNLTIEFNFYCITDNSSNIRKEVNCIPCSVSWLKEQWYKESMFVPGTIPERMTLYLDLDIVIVNNIDCLIPKDETTWAMLYDYMPITTFKQFQGSVWAFNPKYWYSFFDFFKTMLDKKLVVMERSQERGVLSKFHLMNQYKNIQIYPNNWVWSFKRGHLRDEITEMNRYLYRGYTPPNGGLICDFHGWPKIPDLLNSKLINQDCINWIRENWNDS